MEKFNKSGYNLLPNNKFYRQKKIIKSRRRIVFGWIQ